MGIIGNAWNDIKGTPRGLLNLGKTGGNDLLALAEGAPSSDPRRQRANAMGNAVIGQYKDLITHPIRSFEDHPINTLLALTPAKAFRGDSAIVKAGEGVSAKEALIKNAAHHSNLSANERGLGLQTQFDPPTLAVSGPTRAEGIARAQSAHAIRSGLDRPTQFGTTPTPNNLVSFRPKGVVNEGPAGLDQVMNKRRELFDFSAEGKQAAVDARHRSVPLEEMDLPTLMKQMEDAHAKGNIGRGDEIANHIQQKHGFDPYSEDPPHNEPNQPPPGAPGFMKPYSVPNSERTPTDTAGQMSKKLLAQLMQQNYRPKSGHRN